jgi:ribosomal protein S11
VVAAATGAGAGDGQPPVVVGTVRTVEDTTIEVTDAGGAVVRVFVPGTATVTTRGLAGLAFGTPVSVAGTKGVDGSVQATSVTVRAPGS